MKTMRAIVFQEEKNFDSLQIKEVPYPEPKAGEAVVEIKASALNHRDIWITKGLYANIKVPVILGSDGAGIVREVGEGVDKKWLDKPVIINPCLDWGENSRVQRKDFRILGLPDNGTQAQYLAVTAQNIMEKPEYLPFEDAAAIPLGGLTGYRALFTQGKLAPEETVLITGIGGGVAALMMQMALAFNARVLVTSGSDEKIDRALKIGAKGGVNYKKENWSQKITELAGEKGVDLIVDSAGGDGFDDLISIANPGGRVVFFGATLGNPSKINLRKIFWKQLTLQGTTMGHEKDFAQMVHFFESYQIKPAVDGIYPFSRYRQAYQRMMKGEQFGKLVMVPDFE
jgi:NADPH:quinone reductase-like Zn-dependent oxidoreductase